MSMYVIELHTRDGKRAVLERMSGTRKEARVVRNKLRRQHQDGTVDERWVGV